MVREIWSGYVARSKANHIGNFAKTITSKSVQPYCFFVHIAGAVKSAVTIPISAVGRISDAEMAEGVLHRWTQIVLDWGVHCSQIPIESEKLR